MSVADPAVTSSRRFSVERGLPMLSGPVLGLIGVLGLFIVLIGLKGDLHNFLSLRNLQVLVQEGTIPAVIALGMLMVIVSGGIDLSVGSVVANCACPRSWRHWACSASPAAWRSGWPNGS